MVTASVFSTPSDAVARRKSRTATHHIVSTVRRCGVPADWLSNSNRVRGEHQ
jgi:hypothetical protein